jgi:TonB family protein
MRGMDSSDGIRRVGCSRRRMLLAAGGVFALFALCAVRPGQSQDASEYQVKAAYLLNFAKLASWPEQPVPDRSEPFRIGVAGGDDEFLDVLAKTTKGKSVADRPVSVVRINADDELKSCWVVLIRASTGRKRTQEIIAAGVAAGVLLIGEDDSFLQQGGMINLILQNGKVHFAVNRGALSQAGIQVSKELLRLAQDDEGSRKAEPLGPRQLRQSDPPEYPEIARRLKLHGTVHLEVEVRRDGTIKAVRIMGGHPVLADTFSQAVQHWKYEPGPNETVEQLFYTFDH